MQFPGLSGVVPDLGRFDPNDWGLGFELRDGKSPHWTGTRNSARTFGHFGGSGTFLWIDPEAGLACCCLTDLEFGPWAKEAWPRVLGRGACRGALSQSRGSSAPGSSSANSGRMNSSNVSGPQLATVACVIARTDAVRGMPMTSATSPK